MYDKLTQLSITRTLTDFHLHYVNRYATESRIEILAALMPSYRLLNGILKDVLSLHDSIAVTWHTPEWLTSVDDYAPILDPIMDNFWLTNGTFDSTRIDYDECNAIEDKFIRIQNEHGITDYDDDGITCGNIYYVPELRRARIDECEPTSYVHLLKTIATVLTNN